MFKVSSCLPCFTCNLFCRQSQLSVLRALWPGIILGTPSSTRSISIRTRRLSKMFSKTVPQTWNSLPGTCKGMWTMPRMMPRERGKTWTGALISGAVKSRAGPNRRRKTRTRRSRRRNKWLRKSTRPWTTSKKPTTRSKLRTMSKRRVRSSTRTATNCRRKAAMSWTRCRKCAQISAKGLTTLVALPMISQTRRRRLWEVQTVWATPRSNSSWRTETTKRTGLSSPERSHGKTRQKLSCKCTG